MLPVKSKVAGKFAVKQIQTVSDEDFKRIKDQALKMFGQAAADKITEIRNSKDK